MTTRIKPTAKRLHLGSGLKAPEGWVNIDGSWNAWMHQHPRLHSLLVSLQLVTEAEADVCWPRNILIWNLRERLPFDDGVFESVYASHLIEHLYRDDAERLVEECYRVLGPEGVIRLVVPDLKALAEDYLSQKKCDKGNYPAADSFQEMMMLRSKERPKYGPLRALYHAKADFHSHKWLYDQESLGGLLRQAGFTSIRRCRYLESKISAIHDVEDEGRLSAGTLCLEAEKS